MLWLPTELHAVDNTSQTVFVQSKYTVQVSQSVAVSIQTTARNMPNKHEDWRVYACVWT